MANLGIQDDLRVDNSRGKVVSLACKMVGGGNDGSLDLCGRVCLIDEHERILFQTYVKPNLPVTNYRYLSIKRTPFVSLIKSLLNVLYQQDRLSIYSFSALKKNMFCRYETTGIRPEFLRDAMPVRQVQRKIQDYLCNGEPIWQIRSRNGKARVLVGHGLDHDLKCLEIDYPEFLIRDTAKYPPLMKTSKLSNSLKYLTKAYLG